MATYTKPTTRFATSDWFTANYAMSTNAERQRNASHDIRQEAWFLRNETDNKTKWDQTDTNTRLADRVDYIRKWKDILEYKVAETDKEIGILENQKEECEQALEAMNLPEEVNVENLTTREGRMDIDVVEDQFEDQLHKEKEVIKGIKRQLQGRIAEAFEQLNLLREARQQLLLDLQDKNEALGIDIEQYNLTEDSPNISFKPDACRIPKGSTTPQNWEDFSRYNVARADAEMDASLRLREGIIHTLGQTANDLKAQHSATDYTMRKRIHELKRAIDELDWQKKQTEEEIAELEVEIDRLTDAIRAKINPTKLAETRQENRTQRPGIELCRDNVQYGLTDEIKQLVTSKMALEEKMRQSQHSLDSLEKQLHRINEDLLRKNNSLALDEQCAQQRTKLHSQERSKLHSELYPMEKTQEVTGLTREKRSLIAY